MTELVLITELINLRNLQPLFPEKINGGFCNFYYPKQLMKVLSDFSFFPFPSANCSPVGYGQCLNTLTIA